MHLSLIHIYPDNGVRRVIHQEEGILTSTVFKTEAGNLPDNRVNFVREDNDGRIWIGTKRGLALVVDGEVKIVDLSLIHIYSRLGFQARGNDSPEWCEGRFFRSGRLRSFADRS